MTSAPIFDSFNKLILSKRGRGKYGSRFKKKKKKILIPPGSFYSRIHFRMGSHVDYPAVPTPIFSAKMRRGMTRRISRMKNKISSPVRWLTILPFRRKKKSHKFMIYGRRWFLGIFQRKKRQRDDTKRCVVWEPLSPMFLLKVYPIMRFSFLFLLNFIRVNMFTTRFNRWEVEKRKKNGDSKWQLCILLSNF